MCAFVASMYGTKNEVVFEGKVIEVVRGLLQGDSLAPLLHATVLNILVRHLNGVDDEKPMLADEDGKRLFNVWFADDGRLFGRASFLAKALAFFQEEGPELGLILGPDKLKLTIPQVATHANGDPRYNDIAGDWGEFKLVDGVSTRGDTKMATDGIIVLGVPIGGQDHIDEYINGKLTELEAAHDAIRDLKDPQKELIMLQAVMRCKVTHILRSNVPSRLERLVVGHDNQMQHALRVLLRYDGELSERSIELSSLPRKYGGLGLEFAMYDSCGAYIGSRMLTHDLVRDLVDGRAVLELPVECDKTLKEWETVTGAAAPVYNRTKEGVQKQLNSGLVQARTKSIDDDMEQLGGRHKAWRQSVMADSDCNSFVGDVRGWEKDRYKGEYGPNDDRFRAFRTATCRMVGAEVIKPNTKCNACQKIMDVFGDHALSCNKGSGMSTSWKWQRHAAIQANMARLAKWSGCQEGKDLVLEMHESLSAMRPSDIMVSRAVGGVRGHTGGENGGNERVGAAVRQEGSSTPWKVPPLLILNDAGGADPRYGMRYNPDQNFQETSYDVTVTNTLEFDNESGCYGGYAAKWGPGAKAKKTMKAKVKKYKELFERCQQITNRKRRFEPLVWESTGFSLKNVHTLIRDWGAAAGARLGAGRLGGTYASRVKRMNSTAIHFYNSVSIILRAQGNLRVRKSIELQ
jgi:hypothetical protein